LNTIALTDVTLSFDLDSEGNHQFTNLTLLYSTTAGGGAGTFTSFETVDLTTFAGSYHTYSFNASTDTALAVNDQSTLYFEFCFSGSTNAGAPDFTLIDNIQVTALPEPSSYIGGLLGLVGLCWYQRRRFMRLLSLRSA
jgi:hypothetical protein